MLYNGESMGVGVMSEQTVSTKQKHRDILKELPEGTALYGQLSDELQEFDTTLQRVESQYGEAYSRLRELEQKLVSQQEKWLG